METNSIRINHLDAQYLAPRSEDNHRTLQRRLDRIAAQMLTRTLENYFAFLGETETLYFIDELNVDLVLDISRNDDAVARTWGDALGESIRKTLIQGDGLIAFRDRAGYLTGLIEQFLHGSTRVEWFYAEFAQLGSLPVGQAISKLLRENPDDGREAMLELTRRGDLDLLLSSLSDAELGEIVDECLLPASPSFITSPQRWVRSLRQLLSGDGFGLTSVLPRDVARLYLLTLRVAPELGPDVNLARFIRDLLRLRTTVLSLRDRTAFLRLVEAEEVPLCLSLLGESDGGTLLTMMVRESGGVETAGLLRDLGVSHTPTSRFTTDFGGIFLLFPALLELGATGLFDLCSYPDPATGSKRSLFLFLIGLQCLGPHAKRAWGDKALSTFAGMSEIPSRLMVNQYCATLTPTMHSDFAEMVHLAPKTSRADAASGSHQPATAAWFSIDGDGEAILAAPQFEAALSLLSLAVMQKFAYKLGAFFDSSPEYLYQNFLASRATVELSADSIVVRFLTCRLQMVLRMAGFDHHFWQIPWLEDRKLEFKFD